MPRDQLDAIRPEDPNIPAAPDVHSRSEELNAQAQSHKQRVEMTRLSMGWLGGFLGGTANIPSNIALRLPRGLHKRAARIAERERVSLNQWMTAAVAERVGTKDLQTRIVDELFYASSKQPQMTFTHNLVIGGQTAFGSSFTAAESVLGWPQQDRIGRATTAAKTLQLMQR